MVLVTVTIGSDPVCTVSTGKGVAGAEAEGFAVAVAVVRLGWGDESPRVDHIDTRHTTRLRGWARVDGS